MIPTEPKRKQVVQRFIDEGVDDGDTDAFDRRVADEYERHEQGSIIEAFDEATFRDELAS